uniref:Uncharacterized protein n=2 Tax=Human herpesvirus 1 TaxID=10298 RepID=A0A2Z4H8T4_HHV1|nr:hypothetical protein [Human alphaherpesvirus 1]
MRVWGSFTIGMVLKDPLGVTPTIRYTSLALHSGQVLRNCIQVFMHGMQKRCMHGKVSQRRWGAISSVHTAHTSPSSLPPSSRGGAPPQLPGSSSRGGLPPETAPPSTPCGPSSPVSNSSVSVLSASEAESSSWWSASPRPPTSVSASESLLSGRSRSQGNTQTSGAG